MQIFPKKKIIFSDEAHFDLGEYANKRNCRIWGIENQHAYIEKPQHPKRVTIWCGFWSRGIIRPFFFENEQEEAVTVESCWRNFCSQKLKRRILAKFQQYAATCHTAEATLDVLRPEDRIFSRRPDVVWPSWSCDLTKLVSVTQTNQRQLTL